MDDNNDEQVQYHTGGLATLMESKAIPCRSEEITYSTRVPELISSLEVLLCHCVVVVVLLSPGPERSFIEII